MRVSAKTDYALRAMAELASTEGLLKAERIANSQGIPLKFLLNIMTELRQQGLVASHRGSEGGFRLARPADEITLADVIRAVQGSLSIVQDVPPGKAVYSGPAGALRDVWLSLHQVMERMLEDITLEDLVRGTT